MFRRSILRSAITSLILLSFFSSGFAQRRGGSVSRPTFQQPSSVLIRVVSSNDQAVSSVLVQLFSSSGALVGNSSTDSSGQASFMNISAGSYRVQVSGAAIEPATGGFVVSPNETMHNETVQVKMASGRQQGLGSPQPTVSAADLNVPDKARKEFIKGNEAVQQHDLEKARKHYEKAVEDYPKFAAAYTNCALVCMAMKDVDCARDRFQKAISADDHMSRAYVGLSRVRMIEHNYPEAETLLQKSLSMDPVNAEALALLANTELIEGKYGAAILHAHKVHTAARHQFPIAHFIAAKALEAEHHPQDAAAEYKLFLEEAPHDSNAPEARQAVERLAAK